MIKQFILGRIKDRVFGALKGGVPRILDALFAKGGDTQVPAAPGEPPITVTIPTGILRDGANQSIIITVLFALARWKNWNLWFTEDQANQIYEQALVIFGSLAGYLRTRSNNITRG